MPSLPTMRTQPVLRGQNQAIESIVFSTPGHRVGQTRSENGCRRESREITTEPSSYDILAACLGPHGPVGGLRTLCQWLTHGTVLHVVARGGQGGSLHRCCVCCWNQIPIKVEWVVSTGSDRPSIPREP